MSDILSTIMDMRNGQVAADINRKWHEMLISVMETTGKGELTIKIMVKPSKLAMGGAVVEVEADHECKVKKPEMAIGKSIFFVTKEGDLSRSDPSQVDMFSTQGVLK